jgi:fructosamine-3-kinase
MSLGRAAALAAGAALGSAVRQSRPLQGGDIHEAFAATLEDGREVFIKHHASADPAMFPAEARGLEFLRGHGRLRIPVVLAVSSGAPDEPAFLALELLRAAPRRRDFDEELGRGLAELHRDGPKTFGLDHDNFIGRLPQENGPLPDWASFYRERRLVPQQRMAEKAGLVDATMRRDLERLIARTGDLVGPAEPPARLHGDLWGGNLHVDETGSPCLIDPAACGGHREMDLAMMRLFGGFGPRVFAAYDEAYPLDPDHLERVDLYQLYYLLAHLTMFGRSYASSVREKICRYV